MYGIFRLGAIIHTLRHEEYYDISTSINKGDKNYAIYKLKSNKRLNEVEKEKEPKQQGLDLGEIKKSYQWPD